MALGPFNEMLPMGQSTQTHCKRLAVVSAVSELDDAGLTECVKPLSDEDAALSGWCRYDICFEGVTPSVGAQKLSSR
jgi:hypothetical protein